MKKCNSCECDVEKTVISDKDKPEVLEKKLFTLMSSLADTVGIDVFKKVAGQAINDHYHAKKRGKEGAPADVLNKLSEEVHELADHLEELDDFYVELSDNKADGNEVDDLDGRVSHMENFLAEHCSGFIPLEELVEEE